MAGVSLLNIKCTAPIGTGSSANGDVVIVTIYNSVGVAMDIIDWTLAGGVDAFTCPPVITTTDRILQETGDYLLQETNDFIILDQ